MNFSNETFPFPYLYSHFPSFHGRETFNLVSTNNSQVLHPGRSQHRNQICHSVTFNDN